MAQIKIVMDSDEQRAFRAFQRLEDQIRKTEKTTKKLGDATKRGGKEGEKAFGRKAHAGIVSFNAALEVSHKAIALIGKGYGVWISEQKKAVEGLKGIQPVLMNLISISENMRDLTKNIALVRSFAGQGIMPGPAGEIVFAAKSLGLGRQGIQALLKIAPFGGALPFAESIALTRGAFGEKAGTELQIMRQIFVAAQKSKANPQQLARALPDIVSQASALGLSKKEAFAGLVQVVNASASAKEGGTRFKALLAAGERLTEKNPALKDDIRKRGLIALTDFIAAGGATPDQGRTRRSFIGGDGDTKKGVLSMLGSTEAATALRALTADPQGLTSLIQTVGAAKDIPIVSKQMGLARRYPQARAALGLQRAAAEEQFGLIFGKEAVGAASFETSVTKFRTQMRVDEISPIIRSIAEQLARFGRFLGETTYEEDMARLSRATREAAEEMRALKTPERQGSKTDPLGAPE